VISFVGGLADFLLVAFGLLFASLGVLFATPLPVVIFVGGKSCGCAKRSASRPGET
jgi:hypothetical protein